MNFLSSGLALSIRFGVLTLLFALSAFGQMPASRVRIVRPVDETRLVTLGGNTHMLARAEFDRGAAPDSLPARRMMLLLSRAPEQQAALDKLLEEQHTPGSANYRHWLTPAEFGQAFGPADSDVQAITSWLQSEGFEVNRVAAAKNIIEFSGTAGQVRQAFHTQMHKYVVEGREHWANSTDPRVPDALAPVIEGVVSLNNFPRKPLSHRVGVFSRDMRSGKVVPELTLSGGSDTYYALGPADFATIYNTAPLLQAGNNGTGQVIAIVGVTNVHLKDVTDFRNLFNLGAGNTSVVIDGPDPGIVDGDESEALLDLQWANAVAPGASVVLVTAADTETTSGLDLAAFHVVESNIAGVMSESYGGCEAGLGTAGNRFFYSLWAQASAQGITVVIPTGDNGSAGCDYQQLEFVANSGTAVSGLASTPFNVAVGGTDFDDASNASLYWNTNSDPTTFGSAKSYIPESTWNETCAALASAGNLGGCPAMPTSGTPPDGLNLWAGSGGASSCTVSTYSNGQRVCQNGTPKPAWQTGAGVPTDGVRDIPDVSLFAAAGGTSSKSFYIFCQADAVPAGRTSCQVSGSSAYIMGAGGTSAGAPSFAGIVALAQQKIGTRLGNINYLLYSLAAHPGVFNDVVKGNISVPCVAGSPNCSATSGSATGVLVDGTQTPAYTAAAGYDRATGLGSVNANNLVTAIASAVAGFTPTTTALTLNSGTSTVTANHGDAISIGVNVTPTASTGEVSLLGSAGGIVSTTLSSGAASWTSKLFPGGSYTVKAHYAGDGTRGASDSNGVAVVINPEASKTFVNLVTWDATGHFQTFTGNNVPYGSPYVLRMDVTDAVGSVSATQSVSSKCASGTASCPTGTVALTANGVALDGGSFALNSAGHTEDQGIQLAPGSYNVVAAYSGDASYNASSGNSAVTITIAPTTLTVSTGQQPPFTFGNSVQILANVATTSNGAAPTGNVQFFDNGTPIYPYVSYQGNPFSSSGYASYTANTSYSFNSIGDHTITAQYSGETKYASSNSAPFTVNIVQASPRFSGYGMSTNSATPSLPVTLSATLFGNGTAPTGTITFSDNGTPLAGTITYSHPSSTALAASLTYTFAQTGTHAITATYSGDVNYTTGTQQIGTLTVYDMLPVVSWGPNASISPALLNYPTTLSVSFSSVTQQGYGNTPAPTGTVTFFDNGTPLSGAIRYGTSQNALTASLDYSFTSLGTHSITASYSGDAVCAASSTQAFALQVVAKIATSIPNLTTGSTVANQQTYLRVNVNSNVVNVGPTMTGTVTFSEGGTPFTGTVDYQNLSGYIIATLNHTFTTVGVHNITVQYSGDGYYAASQSQVLAVTIVGPLSLRLDSNTVNLGSAGGSSTMNLTVTNNTAAAVNVALTCTPDVSSATCSVTPSPRSVNPWGMSAATVSFTVPALTAAVQHRRNPWESENGIMLAGVFAGACFAARRRRSLVLAVLAMALVLAMVSCGGGGGSNGGGGGGTPPPPASKTYKFTITGTSGANTDTQVLTVTVG